MASNESSTRQEIRMALLVCVCAAVVIGVLAYQMRAPQRLNLGAQDSFFLQGFQTSDADAINRYRWTNGDGRINLWNMGAAAPLEIRARVSSMRAEKIPLEFFVNGQAVAQFENANWETYAFRVPNEIALTPERLRIWIQSDVIPSSEINPQEEQDRDFGAAVAWVEVQPLWECCALTSLVTAPPLVPLAQLGLFATALFLACNALGAGLKTTRNVTLGAAALLGIGLGFARILTTQYLYAFTVGAIAFASVAIVTRYVMEARRQQGKTFGLAETLALVIFFVIVFIHLNRLVVAFADPGEDGQVYFNGARNLWNNAPLYELDAMRGNLFAPVYKIPIFYALLHYPYRSFGVTNFIFGFRIVNEILYLVGLFLLARIYNLTLVSAAGFGLFAVGLLLDPTIDTLRQAQSGLLIVFLMVLSLAFLARGRDGWGGIFLALPFMIKLYPAFLLLPLLLLRKWRALFAFVVTALALFAAGILVAGWEQTWIYFTQVLPLTQGSTAWVENVSLFGFLSRFFTDAWGVNDFTTSKLRALYYISAALIVAISAFAYLRFLAGGARLDWRNWRAWVERVRAAHVDMREAVKWGYALFSLTLLLVAPLTWNHYLPTAILALPALLLYLSQPRPPLLIVASILGIALLVYGIYPIPLQELEFGAWKQFFVSYRFYALALLWGVVVYAVGATARKF